MGDLPTGEEAAARIVRMWVQLPVKGSERYEKLVADVSAVTNRPILFVTRYVDAVLAALREGE